jgi:heme A synthase
MRRLAILACLLTVCITASSALIRHWQAGLGCEAWAACGALFPARADASTAAPAENPPTAIRVARLTHRASASAVGLLVAIVALFGWPRFSAGQRWAAAIAFADTVFLAWLGRYTPHDLPLVTVANVAGGMVLAGALAWIAASPAGLPAPANAWRPSRGRSTVSRAAGPAILALLLMGLMVFSGTMTSVRGVVDACPQLLCLAGARFEPAAYDPWASGGLRGGGEFGMHLIHRALALAFAAAASVAAVRAWQGGDSGNRMLAAATAVLLVAQLALGLATAFGTAPLPTATLHNAVAALLASALAAIAAAASGPVSVPRFRAAADPDRFAGT